MNELQALREQISGLRQSVGTFKLATVVVVAGSEVTVEVPSAGGPPVRVTVPCPPQFVPVVGDRVTLRMSGHTPVVLAEAMHPDALTARGALRSAVETVTAGSLTTFTTTVLTPQITAINQALNALDGRVSAIEARLTAAGIP